MKTLKEQLLEILYTKKIIDDKDLFELFENGLHEAPLKDYAISSIMDRLASNIESLIKERFVEKEFVEWIKIMPSNRCHKRVSRCDQYTKSIKHVIVDHHINHITVAVIEDLNQFTDNTFARN